MLADLDAARGLRSISLRYFNAAGADPDGEIGEAHDPETHLIPLVLAAARDGKSVSVFGDDYDTTDGTCVRDYVHVLDIAEAHVLALEYLLRGEPSCSLNLANARGYSVKEVIATADRVSGRRIRVNITPRRVGDPAVLIGAFDRAQAVNDERQAQHREAEPEARPPEVNSGGRRLPNRAWTRARRTKAPYARRQTYLRLLYGRTRPAPPRRCSNAAIWAC